MSEMKKLRDLCLRITDGSHYSPPASENGYPMLSSKDMGDMDFDYSNIKYIDENEYRKMVASGCKPFVNDVLIIKDGNSYLQKVFVVTEEKDIALLSSIGILRPNTDILDPYYLRYYLLSDFVKHEVAKKYVTGSALPRIILDNFGDIDIPYIDIKEQKVLVALLKDIDYKIENNKAICSNLEAMAKLLYDYWFVQFDFPDENGKPYKSSGGKMVWNDELKREIPVGWEVKELLSFCSWESASQPPKSEFVYQPKDGYVRFIQNRDYDSDSNITYIPLKPSTKKCNKYDILIDKYGDKTAGTVRYGLEGAYNVALGKLTVHEKKMQEYLRMCLSSKEMFTYLHNACLASTRSSMNETVFVGLYVPIPEFALRNRFDNYHKQILDKIYAIRDENRQLTSLRDFLLPMLMNGQVKVG